MFRSIVRIRAQVKTDECMGSQKKVSQTGWLTPTAVYSHTVLDTRGLKSKYHPALLAVETLPQSPCLFQLLVAAWQSWTPCPALWSYHTCGLHMAFSVSLIFWMPVIGLRPTLNPDLILRSFTSSHQQRPFLLISSMHRVWGCIHITFWDHH